ncbi:hypothetical protein A9P82_06620 [Arachidicoccus ginsenosidimutans]|uniref:hypothetical protein n=1 Tax=Arachidicoccus sp. BS20 TaxID=1850526 RepID=UPI0007F0842C|nr:hypothetical protein [Arachidicoccus sp. BS20]ANI88996.1 hypothetical protein A9P82_06620 [Arachidicoccus sp. BS20]
MTDFYSNLLLRYLYNETSETSALRAKRLLESDSEAEELYCRLKEGRRLMAKYLHVQRPRKSLVNNILKYAAH